MTADAGGADRGHPEHESISVVIPAYNASATVARAIGSALAQTRPPLEILVVDDASEPAESQRMRAVAAIDPVVRYIRLESNGGPSRARNEGLERAVGAIVAFLDADDIWLPTKLETCMAVLSSGDHWFVGHNNLVQGRANRAISDRLRPGRRRYRMRRIDVLISTSQFAPSCVVLRKARLPFRFDETIRRSEDYRLWARLILEGHRLTKLTDFLGERDSSAIGESGLSGDAGKILAGHLSTVDYLTSSSLLGRVDGALLKAFMRLKFLRHSRRGREKADDERVTARNG